MDTLQVLYLGRVTIRRNSGKPSMRSGKQRRREEALAQATGIAILGLMFTGIFIAGRSAGSDRSLEVDGAFIA
jgi:hypothetical protein